LPTPSCEETEDQILGPFYRDGAPMRATLIGEGGGEALIVRGVVLGTGSACAPRSPVRSSTSGRPTRAAPTTTRRPTSGGAESSSTTAAAAIR
jgi:hypothetical protein